MLLAAESRSANLPPALVEALAWLASPPSEDLRDEITSLHQHLDDLAWLSIPPLQHLKLVELFQRRTNAASTALRSLLLDTSLPLPLKLRRTAESMGSAHGLLATAYLQILQLVDPERLFSHQRTPARLCNLGLRNLLVQFQISQYLCAPSPEDLWLQAQDFYALIHQGLAADATLPFDVEDAEMAMKTLLALATVRPETCAAGEFAFLIDYLNTHALAVHIRSPHATDAQPNEYWIASNLDQAPVPANRRPPPSGGKVLRFSCVDLGQRAHEHLLRLAEGESVETLGLPRQAGATEYRQLLDRTMRSWISPTKRQNERHRHPSRVEICAHLGSLWRQMYPGHAHESHSELVTEWLVINESTNGFSVMYIGGQLADLSAGNAVGLRRASHEPWHIYIIRWARSENSEHIELGLELVATRAEAVHVAHHSQATDLFPGPALLLPPLSLPGRPEALLAARGRFELLGPFTLLVDSQTRVQVAPCVATRVTLRTAGVDIIEFTRDRY